MRSIGIVGQGFVGQAVREGFKNFYDIETYDKYKQSTCDSIQQLCNRVEIIFVCVPTPMNSDGSCNTTIVDEVIENISNFSNHHIAVVKSTLPPGKTEAYNQKYKNLNIIFNPEFLTEANFLNDFKNQNRIILGGPRPASTVIKNLYTKVFPNVLVIKTGSSTAEMVKYFTNCFLATKVSFSNEIREICEKKSIDYDKVVEYSLHDTRLGKSHFASPGPDLKYGFGGSCLPKDINALIHIAKQMGLNPSVLEGAWKKNLEVRPGQDWTELKGRAVNKDN